ncbi:MAG: CoA-binding protein [Dehalococcoidia bacterium]
MTQNGGFGAAFPPEVIAIVGVSRNETMHHPGYTGARLFRMLREAGFQGRIYPVNPRASEIDGVKAYPNVTSVPEHLDLVTITVPAASVPQVLEDCIAAKALNVQICTSGFGETGAAEGKKLESRMREIAMRGGLRLIGPNCMGFHIPSINMKMFEEVPLVQGPVAFISQSGGHARDFLLRGPELGFGFSKMISYGNALVMDAPDFLEYFAADPETHIICMYLEGIKNGRRLTDLVRQISPVKPVIIWKAGLTYSGARAAASHTGSLAGDRQIWEAFFAQTGAIRVGSINEMAEVAMSFLRLKPLRGKRVAVLASGGGNSVATGDVCAEEGVDMPALSAETRVKLTEFVSLVNQGVMNPMDVPGVLSHVPSLRRALALLAADPLIDIIILRLSPEFLVGLLSVVKAEFLDCVQDPNGERPGGKQVVVAMSSDGSVGEPDKYARQLREAGVTVYGSLSSACRALNRFASYHKFVADSKAPYP